MNETFYHILPSGVKIVHRRSQSEVAYVGIMVGAGTRNEIPALNGIAHYIEHCVFKGAKHYDRHDREHVLSARDILHRVEDLGGELNAYTTKEETTFYAAIPKPYIRHTLGLIGDMILHPTFPKKETDKEVQVILDEIESYNDSPSELIYDDFEGLLFQGDPLSYSILGTKKSLRHISSKSSYPLEWMAQHYHPNKMVVFCIGDIDSNVLVKEVEHIMSQHNPYHPLLENETPSSTNMNERREASFRKHTHQTHVMLGRTCYPLGHERQLSMYLLNNILGGGSLTSRLNLSLREQSGLVYTVESQYVPLSNTGYWSIYFATEPEHQSLCLERVHKVLEQLMNKPISDIQFRQALKQIRGQMAISGENKENEALAMAKQMLYYGSAPMWQETYAKIEQLTPADLYQTAQEMFPLDQLSILRYE